MFSHRLDIFFKENQNIIKPPAPKLDWQDLIFLHESNCALRYTELDSAKMEAKEGGSGDAISLATFALPSPEDLPDFYPQFIAATKNLNAGPSPTLLSSILDEMMFHYQINCYPFLNNYKIMCTALSDIQTTLLNQMQKHIKEHISTGINRYALFERRGEPSLLLMQQPDAQHPYDFSRYPLGKVGSRKFNKESVIGLCDISDDIVKWSLPSHPNSNDKADALNNFNDALEKKTHYFILR